MEKRAYLRGERAILKHPEDCINSPKMTRTGKARRAKKERALERERTFPLFSPHGGVFE